MNLCPGVDIVNPFQDIIGGIGNGDNLVRCGINIFQPMADIILIDVIIKHGPAFGVPVILVALPFSVEDCQIYVMFYHPLIGHSHQLFHMPFPAGIGMYGNRAYETAGKPVRGNLHSEGEDGHHGPDLPGFI